MLSTHWVFYFIIFFFSFLFFSQLLVKLPLEILAGLREKDRRKERGLSSMHGLNRGRVLSLRRKARPRGYYVQRSRALGLRIRIQKHCYTVSDMAHFIHKFV